MKNNVFIKEIFESIQGEGPYIGINQLFVRFSKCNLACSYCDTDFSSNLKEYSANQLIQEISNHKNIHSVSLTGGEPLTEIDFLLEFLPQSNKKIYLETNGTLVQNLERIINYIDIISMDIKLDSSSKNGDLTKVHKDFIKTAVNNNKEIFAKVVFDENITDKEIQSTIDIVKEGDILLILQPKMNGNILGVSYDSMLEIYNKFISKYQNVRLIPQVHKFLNIM